MGELTMRLPILPYDIDERTGRVYRIPQPYVDPETRGLKDDCVKMFFSNSSDKNRHFNKLRKAKAKKKAAKQARKRNRRK